MPFPRLRSLWRNLVHKDERERDLDSEVRAYAALLEDEMVGRGLPREEARRRAAIEVGGAEQVKEEVRAVRMGALLETTWRDARHALRTLARTPAFTAAAVIALALGIGATTAIFSVVDAVLLRPLPYRDPERLAVVFNHGFSAVSAANLLDWRRQATRLAGLAAAEAWGTRACTSPPTSSRCSGSCPSTAACSRRRTIAPAIPTSSCSAIGCGSGGSGGIRGSWAGPSSSTARRTPSSA